MIQHKSADMGSIVNMGDLRGVSPLMGNYMKCYSLPMVSRVTTLFTICVMVAITPMNHGSTPHRNNINKYSTDVYNQYVGMGYGMDVRGSSPALMRDEMDMGDEGLEPRRTASKPIDFTDSPNSYQYWV